MKKYLFILCSVFLLVGCNKENQEIIESQFDSVAETTTETTTEITTETTTESTTEKPTEPEKTEPTYTEIADNIKLYDLKKSENADLIPDEKTLYSKDIEMAGYGILSNEDGNIKLVKDNGEENIIVESLYPDNAYSWVRTEFPVDSDRFAYSLCAEMGNPGFGVYDMKSGENHFVMESYYPKVVRGNSLILAKGKYSSTVGYSEFDLDTYEIRDIPIQADLENLKYRRTNAVSADGSLAAVMRLEGNSYSIEGYSYIITVISLESGETVDEYILETDVGYGNMDLEFASADKLHLYAKRLEDNTYHMYVFDITLN